MSEATPRPRYGLSPDGAFEIVDYNSAKPFSSFFPGVAGLDGIPMWTFYVNRGQCVCSMGVEDKNSAIMEFMPANRAYQLASTQGFRTFVKLAGPGGEVRFYEPFQNHYADRGMDRTQRMVIEPAKLTLAEENRSLGLTFTVEYFNVVGEPYAGLIRNLTITNDSGEERSLEVVDGMPLVVPYGVDNGALKFTRRLVEAFVEVVNVEARAPLFRGKVEPVDRPEVVRIKKGNFYLGFGEDGELVQPIVDPATVFGLRTDYSHPERFLELSGEELTRNQVLENRYPCGMGYFQAAIAPGGSHRYTSIAGHVGSVEELNSMLPRLTDPGYAQAKEARNRELFEQLTQPAFLASAEPALDQYARVNYLDNGLRGGFPVTLKGGEGGALHLYSRKHGDLERDYNDFRLSPTNYSQGNGHYRDVNQNRRSDLSFNPALGSDNVKHFYNLIQLDGFNPQVIKETRFQLREACALKGLLCEKLEGDVEAVGSFLAEPFTPGLLIDFLKERSISLKGESEEFVGELISLCDKVPDSEFGEGYWTDHWTYNQDLLENFLAIYPEELGALFFEDASFTFFDSPHRVKPRDEKYVLWDGKPMQLRSVFFDEDKAALMAARNGEPELVRKGSGEIFRTTLAVKMLSLIANKVASLDPEGVGVEMEADKPNWYDALNGLPGVHGSSMNETLETRRTTAFLLEALEGSAAPATLSVYEELSGLMGTLDLILEDAPAPFTFWDRASEAKERYREKTRLGVSGTENRVDIESLKTFLRRCLAKLDKGVAKGWDRETGILSTYFMHEVTDYEILEVGGEAKVNDLGMPCYRAKGFRQIALPAFLEGPVHWLRSRPPVEEARKLHRAIRQSGLYDKKLGMYKVNAPLADQPMEIGRNRVFSPGWFENESVWLHMEYKYMLELLRNGLFEEFYGDFKTVFVPFFDPEVYGRSILENSSFIVTEANPDPSIHGNGFVARLSGATAEFIEIMLLMSGAAKPFRLEGDELSLAFEPRLPSWLFTTEALSRPLRSGKGEETLFCGPDTFSFILLGWTRVTYHNPQRKDTFGQAGVAPVGCRIHWRDGGVDNVEGATLGGTVALKVRNGEAKSIAVELG